jgi:hypothetical protein
MLRLIARRRPGDYQNSTMDSAFVEIKLGKRQEIIPVSRHHTTTAAGGFVEHLTVVCARKPNLSEMDGICAFSPQGSVLLCESFAVLLPFVTSCDSLYHIQTVQIKMHR